MTIKEVYEKYKNKDDLLSHILEARGIPFTQFLSDMWQAIWEEATREKDDELCPQHDIWTFIDKLGVIQHQYHVCLCNGKRQKEKPTEQSEG